MPNPRLPFLREKTAKLPDDPGVYLMRNQKEEIIYVGKAKVLRSRVSSYFRSLEKHTEKTYKLVENIYDFNIIVTNNEFEALVLEASLIKQYRPKYNILLKDDKGYNYIKISKEPYPRITAENIRDSSDGSTFLGPYTSSFVVSQTVEEVNRAFQLPTCRRKFPEDFRKARPCLNFHIKRCMGICTGRFSQQEYGQIIKQGMDFITSGSGPTLERLKEEMALAAEQLQFEKAAGMRDKIKAIQRITDEQNVVFVKSPEQDVVGLAQSGSEASFALLKLRGQRLVDKQDFYVGEVDNQPSARREFLLSYYNHNPDLPPIISVDGEVEDHQLLEEYFSKQAGRLVEIRLPQRGEKVRLVEMARQNAAQILSQRYDQKTGRDVAVLDELARLLGLEAPPSYIEAYDISNMGEETMVAGMVVFKDARPYRSAYKKFNIKTVQGTDDYASMREVIARRLARYEEEKDTGEGFGRLPDLILLDGGKGHVNAVAPVLSDMGFSIPLFGMVKDQKHRTRAIATDGGEIAIQANRGAFTLITTIQDEVHRFSISHLHARRKKKTFTSELTTVEGIGKTRVTKLMRHFKTQKALAAASVEELAAAPGMSRPAAKNLYAYFHPAQPEQQGAADLGELSPKKMPPE